MHNRTLLTALATAAAVAIATPSLSQAQKPTPQTSKGEVAMAPNFGSLISALNATSAQNDKLKAMTEITAANVQLVNVEDLLKGQNVEALNAALKTNEADITTLRTTLGANTSISGVLTANSVPLTAADVIATDVGADGKVVIYYWKKAQ
jgi:phage baseplate assembly protein W